MSRIVSVAVLKHNMEDGPSLNTINTASSYCWIVTLFCSGINNNSHIQEVNFMSVIIPVFLPQCSPAGEIYIFFMKQTVGPTVGLVFPLTILACFLDYVRHFHRTSHNIKPLSSELNNNHLFAVQSSYGNIWFLVFHVDVALTHTNPPDINTVRD